MRLDMNTIRNVAIRVYQRHFGDNTIDGAFADDFIDSSGNDAIKVIIVAKEGFLDALLGGTLGDAAVDLQDELTMAGEERFAYIGYSEAGEFQVDGDTDEEDNSKVVGALLGRP